MPALKYKNVTNLAHFSTIAKCHIRITATRFLMTYVD